MSSIQSCSQPWHTTPTTVSKPSFWCVCVRATYPDFSAQGVALRCKLELCFLEGKRFVGNVELLGQDDLGIADESVDLRINLGLESLDEALDLVLILVGVQNLHVRAAP